MIAQPTITPNENTEERTPGTQTMFLVIMLEEKNYVFVLEVSKKEKLQNINTICSGSFQADSTCSMMGWFDRERCFIMTKTAQKNGKGIR